MISDKLFLEVKGRNRKAQKEFYDKYSERMFKLTFRYVNNESDAGGIVNFAFYKIFKNLETFKYNGEKSLIGWMRKIVINEALGFLRLNVKFIEIQEDKNENDSVHLINDDNHELDIYYNLIKALPDDYRTVFNLYAIEGFSHKEISEKLNIQTSSSRVYLTRARKILQEKLICYERQ